MTKKAIEEFQVPQENLRIFFEEIKKEITEEIKISSAISIKWFKNREKLKKIDASQLYNINTFFEEKGGKKKNKDVYNSILENKKINEIEKIIKLTTVLFQIEKNQKGSLADFTKDLMVQFKEYNRVLVTTENFTAFFNHYKVLKNKIAEQAVAKYGAEIGVRIEQNYFISDAAEIKIINNVSEYFAILNANEFKDDELAFRGQIDSSWRLIPSIFRNNYYKKEEILYKEINSLIPDEFYNLKTTYEKLLKMQHNVYPTRLLDITHNPLIALYFACEQSEKEEENKSDGRVFFFKIIEEEMLYYDSDKLTMIAALAKTPLNISDSDNLEKENTKERGKFLHIVREDKSYFSDKIMLDDLKYNYYVKGIQSNNRIINQNGSFIIWGLNDKLKKERKHLEETGSKGFKYLKNKVFIIPYDEKKDIKKEIIKELKSFNIHKGTVYPNIEKIADYLKNQKFSNIK